MSIVLLTEILAMGSLVSAVSCCALEIAMVAAVRRGLAGWQPSELQRDIVVTLRSHRRFYPASRLRAAFVGSSLMLTFCIAGLIAVHRAVHGLGMSF